MGCTAPGIGNGFEGNRLKARSVDRPSRIYLIGPRASGKSTLGKRLAHWLRWHFVDTDQELERRHCVKIRDWIPNDLEGFRLAEWELLQDLAQSGCCVVALGGGIVETEPALQFLSRQPGVLALRAPLDELTARQVGGERPALTTMGLKEEVYELWQRRSELYEEAAQGRWINTADEEEQAWKRLQDYVVSQGWHSTS